MSRRLEVRLHDHLVGHISELPDGGSEFRFLDSYRDLVPRPVLGQRFEDDLDRVWRSRKGQGLPDFFANLVPEGRLREVIEETTAVERGDDLALLSFVGEDLPGAVVVRVVAEQGSLPLEATAPGHTPDAPDEPGTALRFSLAGVQLKFSMLREADKLVLPARHQGGEWIVKLDSLVFPALPENELSMLSWARHAGFDVPEHYLHPVAEIEGFPRRLAPEGSHVLAIRRYDRGLEGRVHQEDFAQAVGLPASKKYEQVTYEAMAHLIRRVVGEEAVDELVRRLALVVACGNNDAHLKNWSLLYPNRIQAQWSPLYDQVATVAWPGPDRALALKLAGVKEFDRIDRAAFERFADKAELEPRRVLEQVDETLDRLRQAWGQIETDLPLPKSHARALQEHWERVPLLQDAGPLPR